MDKKFCTHCGEEVYRNRKGNFLRICRECGEDLHVQPEPASAITTGQQSFGQVESTDRSVREDPISVTNAGITSSTTTAECGYCIRRDGRMNEPKTLPCGHIHCAECLKANFDTIGIVQCPICSEVFDVELSNLPSSTFRGDSVKCDICERKGIQDCPASMYCVSCCKKFCNKHLESHDDLHEDHQRIEIKEYRRQARKLMVMYCSNHSEQTYSLGCTVCLTVFCAHCMLGADACINGCPHKLVTLDHLVTLLTKDIGKLSAQVINKEEKLSTIFKMLSNSISDYQTSTTEMIETLHQARDRQIEVIRAKYDKLEMQLVKSRGDTQLEMTRLMEEDIGIKLASLSTHRLRIEARLRDNHQVDIVNGYRDVKDEITRLIREEMPSVRLKTSLSLICTDAVSDLGVALVSVSVEGIDWGLERATPEHCPKSLTLLHTAQMSSNCYSVCCYKGNTYIGLKAGGVDRIDKSFQITNSFISLRKYVFDVVVYNDRVYSLVHGTPYVVYVHSLAGQLITQWTHTDNVGYITQFTIVSGQVVIPDRGKKVLALYSLSGEELRRIPCPQLSASCVALCTVTGDSVVVSDYGTSQVFRLNITTGEMIWMSKLIANPQGITRCGWNYICVASYKSDKIQIINIATGATVSKVTDGAFSDTDVMKLHITGNILIVPAFGRKKVMFYRLN